GQALDRLAELLHRGVLEERPHVADLRILTEPNEVALGRGEGVLEHRDQHVRTGPVRARLRRPAAELLLVEAHHLARDLREDARAWVAGRVRQVVRLVQVMLASDRTAGRAARAA